jgi:diacylglycerol kinase family enzyme
MIAPDDVSAERRFAFFVHPASGNGRAARRLKRALDCVSRSKETTHPLVQRSRVVETRSLCETRAGIRSLGHDEIPVAAGGDGALQYLVRALRCEGLGSRLVAVLPLGTGNAFAHSIGLATLEEATLALDAGQARALDLMVTTNPETPVVVASLSVGFEAEFIRSWNRARLNGSLAGGLVALARAATARTAAPQLWLDGAPSPLTGSPVWSAGLYNISHYAFGKLAIPECNPSDGAAEAIVYRTAWSYVRALATGNGSISRGVERRRWRMASVETSGPIQADGETLPGREVTVHVEPGGLRVIAM